MNTLTIKELPPPNLRASSDVQKFWQAQMNGHFSNPGAHVTVTLPRKGPDEYLQATVEAALALQRAMGPRRFHFTDNLG